MLRSFKNLLDCSIGATDGVIGKVKDCLFDDELWVIRYFVVDTGVWLTGRQVLISPVAVSHPLLDPHRLPVSLTMDQVRHGPDVDTDAPVSRQQEQRYLQYYGYPYYWSGGGLWGWGAHPGALLSAPPHEGAAAARRRATLENLRDDAQSDAEHHKRGDHHLRSCRTVMAYHVEASDGRIGHVRDYLVDDSTWAVRYLIARTGDAWRGHDVLIAPDWIESVRWDDNAVVLSLTRDQLESAPPYAPDIPIDREGEAELHAHYGRSGYWTREADFADPEGRYLARGVV